MAPDDIPDEIVSIFDPFGNVVLTALSFDLVGEDMLVTGAVGIMAALVAHEVGGRKVDITDINPERLKRAAMIRVKHTVDVRHRALDDVMTELDMKEGFDVRLECRARRAPSVT